MVGYVVGNGRSRAEQHTNEELEALPVGSVRYGPEGFLWVKAGFGRWVHDRGPETLRAERFPRLLKERVGPTPKDGINTGATVTKHDLIQKIYHAMQLAEGDSRGNLGELIELRVKSIGEDFMLAYESATSTFVLAAVLSDRELYVRPTLPMSLPVELSAYLESTGIMQLLRQVQIHYCVKTHSGAWKFSAAD